MACKIIASPVRYASPAAASAIEIAVGRRVNPLAFSPSLACLKGRARRYAGSYRQSIEMTLSEAGVVRSTRYGFRGVRYEVITMPHESPSAAVRIVRDAQRRRILVAAA